MAGDTSAKVETVAASDITRRTRCTHARACPVRDLDSLREPRGSRESLPAPGFPDRALVRALARKWCSPPPGLSTVSAGELQFQRNPRAVSPASWEMRRDNESRAPAGGGRTTKNHGGAEPRQRPSAKMTIRGLFLPTGAPTWVAGVSLIGNRSAVLADRGTLVDRSRKRSEIIAGRKYTAFE